MVFFCNLAQCISRFDIVGDILGLLGLRFIDSFGFGRLLDFWFGLWNAEIAHLQVPNVGRTVKISIIAEIPVTELGVQVGKIVQGSLATSFFVKAFVTGFVYRQSIA